MLALGGIAGLAAVEAGLKVIAATPLWRVLPVIEPILGAPDYNIGYGFTPHVSGIWVRENRAPLTITDLGLRGPAGIEVAKRPGEIRVAITGDSHVEGLQVEYQYTFTALTQAMLNRAARLPESVRQVQVLNLAMSGIGPLRQLVRLEHFGYSLQPDVVMLISDASDFLTSEMTDDRLNPGYVPDASGKLVRGYAYRNRLSMRYADTIPGRAFLGLLRHSEVARLLYLRSKNSMLHILGLAPAARPTPKSAAHDGCHQDVLASLHRLWVGHAPERHWQAATVLLDEYSAGAREHRVAAFYAMRNLPVPKTACAEQQAMRAATVAVITAELARRGINFIDIDRALADRLRAESSDDLSHLYGFGRQLGGGHLNYEGHQAYATVLSEVVARSLRERPQSPN
ncbi:hypothetical protein [Ferrovibrio sp.]|uniref:hypothetical protein n=1 Tax=Ferrovibrio sp. TaxID=1917215 RepID=UPI000CA80241|nr:hypothetical protein [Ferrovibrio sp.]PJI41992.1 MAG: hypothetical protein CTR53_05945 [Ferrovibrio sp.]